MKSTNRLPKLILAVAILIIAINSYAQIGINTTNPDSTSVLDITSSNRGLLIPRLTSGSRESLGTLNPADGLLVYDTNLKMFFFWNKVTTKWEALNPWVYANPSQNSTISIRPDNNVGVGVTNTSYKMEVNGSLKSTSLDAATINTTTVNASYLNGYGSIPVRGIIMWSGDVNQIPDGWWLCDGSNGTPDLRGRFVVGYARDWYDHGAGIPPSNVQDGNYQNDRATGGENFHTLSIGEMPAHGHSGTTNVDGVHSHTIFSYWMRSDDADDRWVMGHVGADYDSNRRMDVGGTQTDGEHAHNFSTNEAGGSGAHENRPPYYVLAYIMRIR